MWIRTAKLGGEVGRVAQGEMNVRSLAAQGVSERFEFERMDREEAEQEEKKVEEDWLQLR
jgi:hypothetical protein